MKKIFSAGMFVLIYLAVYYVFQYTYIIVATTYYYVSDTKLQNLEVMDWLNNKLPSAIVFAAAISFLVYAWIVKASKKKDIFDYCKFNPISLPKTTALIFAGLSLVSLNALVVVGISMLLPEAYEAHVENMMGLTSSGGLWMIFSVGLAAPFIEEVMFRGLITNELDKVMSYKWVLFIQALLFGLYHMNVAQGIYTFILAIFMGLTLHWTNSIWAPMIIHIANNLSSALMSEYIDASSDIVNIGFGIWIGLSLLFILPFTLKYLYKTRSEWTSEEY